MSDHLDHIRLKDLRFWGRHGHLPLEKELGNRFEVDVDLQVDVAQAAREDAIQHTADLAQVYEIVRWRAEGEPCQLLETLASRIAADLLELGNVQAATVRVRKLFPPLTGATHGTMEVEITRGS